MNTKNTSLITKVVFVVFLYIFIHSFVVGLTSKPTEGDSLYYHIPIARSVLSGEFLYPDYGTVFHQYFPGATESILATFIALGIPLNLFNVAALAVLFAASYFVSRQSNNSRKYSILFASCICTLQVIVRWMHAQTVDIWLGAYYLFSLGLLLKPKKTYSYFLKLGITTGMLIGSKYSGLLFATALLLVYRKNFLRHLNFPRLITFGTGVGLLGVFWYLRNWVVMNNPFYPLDTFLFEGIAGNKIIETPIWKATLTYPFSMFNAFLSEYMIWSLVIATMLFFIIYKLVKKENTLSPITSNLVVIGLINLVIFSLLPSGDSYQLHVSQFRFSYPVFIPLILCLFHIAKKLRQSWLISLLTLSNIVVLSSLNYKPKLIFICLPCVIILFNKKYLDSTSWT